MAIDLTKMKNKLDELKNRGGNKSNFWRPNDGEQTIRIVPTKDGDPFKDFWFHYDIGENSGFLCPKKNFGDDCAACSFASTLFKEGTDDSVIMAKKLLPRQRFFSPVLVRGEEKEGVRIWGYGKMAYESLLNLVLNPEYGDITDIEEGTDLVLNYGKPAGASFPQTKLTPRRRNSVLCDEKIADCTELLESIPDILTLFERKTSEEVGTILDEYLSSEEADDNSKETVKYSDDGGNKVEQAFQELLNG